MPKASPPRDAALSALCRFEGGAARAARAESLLDEASVRHTLDARDRALAMELFYGVLRNLVNLDHILYPFIKEPAKGVSDRVRNILRLAAYQVSYLDKIPERAAVYEAVEQAKADGPGAGRFVNAALRSFLRGAVAGAGAVAYPDRVKDPTGYLSIKYSYPAWLSRRWAARFGVDEAEALMRAGNVPPPVTLRTNTLKTTRDSLRELFDEAGITTRLTGHSPYGLVLESYPRIANLPGYADGLFAVQDEAAQLVSMLMRPKPGDVILDACAAPGGKATHISELSGGGARIVAVDIGLDKLRRLNENIARLGMTGVYPVVADSSGPLPFKGAFDGVMLDAPCTALGVVRRRPEIKYARRAPDISRMAKLQGRMLKSVSKLIRPGGSLVYAVCSTEPEEGEDVVRGFLAGGGFRLQDARGFLPEHSGGLVTGEGFLRTFPHRHGTDGFFAARLVRV